MESWWHDLRFGLRTLERDLGFAIVAILTLALGIGANAAVWSIARAAVFRALPYGDSEEVLIVQRVDRDGKNGPISVAEFRDLRQRQRSFESFALARQIVVNLSDDGEPQRLSCSTVSSDFLDALGIDLALGRGFQASDDVEGAPRTVVLSHEIWQRRFSADPGILDRTLRIDGQTHEIIGVLPPHMGSEILVGRPLGELLVPITHYFDQLDVEERASRLALWGVARLAPDTPLDAARDDLARISRELAGEFPSTNQDSRFFAEPVAEHVFARYRATIGALVAGALLVLLVACANLANLLLTRLARRRSELATRLALGASGRRVLRQLLTESLLLGALGGGLGLVLAGITLEVLPRYLSGVEYLVRSRIDLPLAFLTLVAAVVTSLVVCGLPSIRALRRGMIGPMASLRVRGSTRAHRLRWSLISAEVALAMVALVGAGLLLETMSRLNALDSGLDSEKVFCLDLLVPQETFDDRESWTGFFDLALERLGAIPGVETVAATSSRPFDGFFRTSPVMAGDRALPGLGEHQDAIFQMISPGYFGTLGIPLVAGRGFETTDDDRGNAERVVIISESVAKYFWPDHDAVGQQLAFEFLGTPNAPDPQWRRIVGVVADVNLRDPRSAPIMAVFAPYTQLPSWFQGGQSPTMTLMLRSTNDNPRGLFRPARQALFDLAPYLPILDGLILDQARKNLFGEARQVTWLLTAFAFLAASLVAVGVFGLVSYVVTASTREIGIRMAFGASRQRVVLGILERCASAMIIGLALGGFLIAFFLAPMVEGQLFGVGIDDFGALTWAVLILMGVGLVAALLPARRATQITPARALRYE